MSRERYSSNYHTNYDEDENPASFEVIRRYTPDNREETVVYNRANAEGGAAAGPLRGPEEPESNPREECKKSLEIILENVGPDDGQRDPLIIALIGAPGVGKSSMICSLAAGISQERWREYAYVGSFGEEGEPVTVFVETFEKCGMQRIPQNAERFAENLLPTMIDIAGVENENNKLWKELLEIVFFGRLPKGESLYAAYKYGLAHGVQGLRQKHSNYDENLKVDRIIFIASATEETPESLIDCVRAAARPGGDADNKRAIPLFGVMTKVDQVATHNKPGEVSQEVFKKREERFIHKLGLDGVTTRYLAMSNYCDATDMRKKRLTSNIPEMDAPLLQFMTQVCDPAIAPINAEFEYTQKGEEWVAPNQGVRKRKPTENEKNTKNEKTAQKLPNKGNTESSTWQVILAIFVLIFVIFMILAAASKR